MAKAAPKKAGVLAPRAFDAGKSGRRLRALPTASVAINRQIRSYGAAVLARSRYLAANNAYAAAAKQTYVSALVGLGIKPSSKVKDRALRELLHEVFLDWTDETDADGLTDFYGQQAIIAAEMFEAGECFVRLRSRRDEDGFTIPLQLQILPAEMLPINDNRKLGTNQVECGIEFNGIGQRVAYHFLRDHPGSEIRRGLGTEQVRVPAEEILHLYKPFAAGQVRGIPHTLAGIVVAAIMDCYDDAELERKRTAALFGAFITSEAPDGSHPLEDAIDTALADGLDNAAALEPGIMANLMPGEDIKFAEPADVGGSYEAFQYRNLLRMAAGFGVPYAAMTGDLRQTSYGSIRAGLIEFRRRIEASQHHVMVFQFCRPIWNRFLREAALNGALEMRPTEFLTRERELRRVTWMPPAWEWIDPYKDLQAEKLAVDNGFKARSDVIAAQGFDAEETDARIAADREREAGIPPTSIFGAATPAAPAPPDPDEDAAASEDEPPQPAERTDQ